MVFNHQPSGFSQSGVNMLVLSLMLSSSTWVGALVPAELRDLFVCLGCCEQCCYEHRGPGIFLNYSFVLAYAQERDCWIIQQHYFQLWEECLYCFPQWLFHFTFPPAVKFCFVFFSHPLQHLLFVDFFHNGLSDWYEVALHYSFDLHFSNNQEC